jgi:Flp pilus assembly protein CpaB
MRPARRIRLFVARRPLVYWLLVAAVAVATASLVLTRLVALDEARRQWGRSRTVLVARHELRPGDLVGASDVRAVRWPEGLVPDGVLDRLDRPTVVAAAVEAGEPLLVTRLGRAGAGPVASRLPPGTRGVTIPTGDMPLPVAPGDRVDLVGAGPAAPPRAAATHALVLGAGKSTIVVAVRADELADVATVLAGGSYVVALDADPPAGTG